MATMLIGGLWHGANWTFVVWGGLHGSALAVTRALERARERRGRTPPPGVLRTALGVFVTFHFVCIAWVFFRANDFPSGARGEMASPMELLQRSPPFTPTCRPTVLAILTVGLVHPRTSSQNTTVRDDEGTGSSGSRRSVKAARSSSQQSRFAKWRARMRCRSCVLSILMDPDEPSAVPQ